MNTMNPGIELDEEMISVSPIYKSTPVNNKPNGSDQLSHSPEGANNSSPPSVFGSSPPSMIRRSPTLQHQHSYAGHEEEMDEDTNTVGSVPRAAAPSGRQFLSTRHLSIEEYNGGGNGNNNEENNVVQAASPSRNNSSQGWTDHGHQRLLFHSPTTDGEISPNNQEEERQQPPLQSSSFGVPDDGEEEEEDDNDDDDGREEETAEERARREEEESIALAQMLMAEEAVASHRMSADFLRMNSDQFSAEDFAALQDALREEEEAEYDDSAAAAADEVEEDLSYDALLRLGDAMGDVKTDRWTKIAQKEIEKLKTFKYDPSIHTTTKGGEDDNDTKMEDIDDSELKCLICQFTYEKGDELRRLPCCHCFHKECIDQWLLTKDCCAYCRQSILPGDEDKKETQN